MPASRQVCEFACACEVWHLPGSRAIRCVAGDKISGRRGTNWGDAIGSADWTRRADRRESEVLPARQRFSTVCACNAAGSVSESGGTELLIGGLESQAREL